MGKLIESGPHLILGFLNPYKSSFQSGRGFKSQGVQTLKNHVSYARRFLKRLRLLRIGNDVGAVMLLARQQEGHAACEKTSGELLILLSAGEKCRLNIWPSWCHCHLLSLASVKSSLILPLQYHLTTARLLASQAEAIVRTGKHGHNRIDIHWIATNIVNWQQMTAYLLTSTKWRHSTGGCAGGHVA